MEFSFVYPLGDTFYIHPFMGVFYTSKHCFMPWLKDKLKFDGLVKKKSQNIAKK
jgi:hypothetical protein